MHYLQADVLYVHVTAAIGYHLALVAAGFTYSMSQTYIIIRNRYKVLDIIVIIKKHLLTTVTSLNYMVRKTRDYHSCRSCHR